MAEEKSIEERVTALEIAFAELQRRLNGPKESPNWLDAIVGSMRDMPEFEEVIALGRAYRMADRPEREDDAE